MLKEKRLEAEKEMMTLTDDSAESPGGGYEAESIMGEEPEDVASPSSSSLPSSRDFSIPSSPHCPSSSSSPLSSKKFGTIKYSKSWKKIYIQRQIAENSWKTGQVKRVTTQ